MSTNVTDSTRWISRVGVISLLVGVVAVSSTTAARTPTPSLDSPQWEYLSVLQSRVADLGEGRGGAVKRIDGVEPVVDLTAGLNRLGMAGWELIIVDDAGRMHFKRPR